MFRSFMHTAAEEITTRKGVAASQIIKVYSPLVAVVGWLNKVEDNPHLSVNQSRSTVPVSTVRMKYI